MAISTLSPNYVTVDHLVPVDADLLSRSPVLQPSQDDQGWENDQDEKRDHCFPFTRSRSAVAQIDIWPGPVSASWAWPATTGPSNLRRTSASATTTPFDRRFEDTLAAFRACCGRSRIHAGVDSSPEPGGFHTRCTRQPAARSASGSHSIIPTRIVMGAAAVRSNTTTTTGRGGMCCSCRWNLSYAKAETKSPPVMRFAVLARPETSGADSH